MQRKLDKIWQIYRCHIELLINQLIKKTLTGLRIISEWTIIGNGRRLTVFRGKLYNPITAAIAIADCKYVKEDRVRMREYAGMILNRPVYLIQLKFLLSSNTVHESRTMINANCDSRMRQGHTFAIGRMHLGRFRPWIYGAHLRDYAFPLL